MKTNTHFLVISIPVLLGMRNDSDKNFKENQNTYFTFNNVFFRTSRRLWDNVDKYCREGQATDDNMAYARCMLDI